MFPSFPYGKNLPVSVFVSKMQLMLTLHSREFWRQNSEHASTFKILRARASERSANFCEQLIRTKAKFCEHFQIGWDHSISLNLLRKFPENPEIAEFLETEPFYRKFRKLWEKRQMGRKQFQVFLRLYIEWKAPKSYAVLYIACLESSFRNSFPATSYDLHFSHFITRSVVVSLRNQHERRLHDCSI